jgi:hypothetical protein
LTIQELDRNATDFCEVHRKGVGTAGQPGIGSAIPAGVHRFEAAGLPIQPGRFDAWQEIGGTSPIEDGSGEGNFSWEESRMSFERLIPRPFTSGAIQMYAPLTSGVYGISNASEWIYVGEADNIQDALLEHLHDVDTSLMKRQPTGFVFEVCDGGRRTARLDRLVLEYEPICNRVSSRS